MERVDPRAAICSTAAAMMVPPPFETIQQIFSDNCVTCHSGVDDLDLSSGSAWRDLVNHPAPAVESCGGTLVVPGDAQASYLMQKLESDHPCAGSRMPQGDILPVPLPACVIALVRGWITGGAMNAPADGGTD